MTLAGGRPDVHELIINPIPTLIFTQSMDHTYINRLSIRADFNILILVQKVYRPTGFTKLNENCGLPDFVTDYQIRHLGNPSGLLEILLKIDP